MPIRKSGKKPAKKDDDGIAENLIGLVKTSVLAGIGMAFLGEEKIEEWARKIAKKNKMSPQDIGNFIEDVKKQSNTARNDVEKRFKEMMKENNTISNKIKSGISSKKIQPKKKSQSNSKLQRWSVSFIPNKNFSDNQS